MRQLTSSIMWIWNMLAVIKMNDKYRNERIRKSHSSSWSALCFTDWPLMFWMKNRCCLSAYSVKWYVLIIWAKLTRTKICCELLSNANSRQFFRGLNLMAVFLVFISVKQNLFSVKGRPLLVWNTSKHIDNLHGCHLSVLHKFIGWNFVYLSFKNLGKTGLSLTKIDDRFVEILVFRWK